MKTHTPLKSIRNLLVAIFSSLLLFFSIGSNLTNVKATGATSIDPVSTPFNKDNALVIAKNVDVSQVDVQVTGASPTITRMTGNKRPTNMTDSDATQIAFASPADMQNAVINVKYAKAVGTYGDKPIYAQLKIHDIQAQPQPPQYGPEYMSWEISDKLYNGIQSNGEQQYHMDLTFTDENGTPIDVGEGGFTTYLTLNSLNQATASATNGSFNHIITGNEFANYEKMGSLPYYKTNDSILKDYTSPWSGTPVIGGNRSAKTVKNNVDTDFGFADVLGQPTFTNASASFQVQGSTLKFVIGNSASQSEDNKLNGGDYGYLNSQWTAFSSATLWNPVPEQPTKDVMQNDTDDPSNQANFHSINRQTVDPNEKFEYTISEPVGQMNVTILNKYKTFEFSDKLPDEVDYLKNGYVTNDAGKKLPDDAGNFTFEDGILKYTFSDNYLANIMPYSGETYTVHMPVQVKANVKPNTVINNVGHVQIDKDKADTNKTENPVGSDPGTQIYKKIFVGKFDNVKDWDSLFKSAVKSSSSADDNDTAKTQNQAATKTLKKQLTRDSGDDNYDGSDALKDEQKLTAKDDTTDVHFAVQFKLSKYGDFSSLTLEDKLHDAFNYKSAKIIDSKGKDLTNDGKLDTGSSKHDVTWTANDAESLRGKTVYLYITVNLNKDYKYTSDLIDSQTGNYLIPNDANAIVGKDTYKSNQVHVVVPNPEGTLPATTKSVVDANGNDVNHKEVANGDTLYYHVDQKVGNLNEDMLKPYSSFGLSDKLDPNVKYVESSVVNKDTNKKIDDTNTTEYDQKTHTVSWTASKDFLSKMPLKGETYELVIKVKVDNSTALENALGGDNKEDPGTQVVIKNIGQSTINDKPQKTNEVENPLKPKDPVKPTKTVVDADGKDMNHKVVHNGDILTYKVDEKVGTLGKDLVSRYKSFLISDKLDNNLDYIKADLVDKANPEKEISDPSQITFDQTQNTVTWTASSDFLQNMKLQGETYELVIQAKVNVKDGGDSKDQIINTATVNIDDNPQLTNEVENPLNHKNPAPTKSVVDKDGKDINNAKVKPGDELYYHVDQKVGTLGKDLSQRYPDFSIKDQLDNRVIYKNAYVINKADGKKMSKPSELTFEPTSNTVLFTASKDFLDKMELKGETYELVIKTVVKGNSSDLKKDSSNSDQSADSTSNANDQETQSSDKLKELEPDLNSKSDSSFDTKSEVDTKTASDSDDSTANNDSSDTTTPAADNLDSSYNDSGENDIVNVATSTLGGEPLDTNEVRNPLEPDKNPATPDKDNPKDQDNPSDEMPEDAPSYKKMAQTGSISFWQQLLNQFFALFK